MKVKFKTNLDLYESSWFPQNLSIVPVVGDVVFTDSAVHNHLKSMRKPLYLTVVSRTIVSSNLIEIELYYSESQLKAMALQEKAF